MFSMTSVFVNLSETMAETGFLVSHKLLQLLCKTAWQGPEPIMLLKGALQHSAHRWQCMLIGGGTKPLCAPRRPWQQR